MQDLVVLEFTSFVWAQEECCVRTRWVWVWVCVSFWNSCETVMEGRHGSRMQLSLILKCDFVPVCKIILEESKNGWPKTQWFLTSQLFQTWRSQTAILAPSAVHGFTSKFPSLFSYYLPCYLSLSGSCW